MGWAGHPTEHVLGHRTWDPKSLHTMHHHATHISSVTPSTSLNTSLMHQNQTSFTSHLGREFRRKKQIELRGPCWLLKGRTFVHLMADPSPNALFLAAGRGAPGGSPEGTPGGAVGTPADPRRVRCRFGGCFWSTVGRRMRRFGWVNWVIQRETRTYTQTNRNILKSRTKQTRTGIWYYWWCAIQHDTAEIRNFW